MAEKKQELGQPIFVEIKATVKGGSTIGQ